MKRSPAIKVCGMNDAAVAQRAEELGADYLGFIFAEGSPRRVSPEDAHMIVAALSGRARKVGVFTSAPVHEIIAVAEKVPLDVVQLHSRAYGVDAVRALRSSGFEVWQLESREADAMLLDGVSAGMSGGTGKRADWQRAAELAASGIRIVLAGGISADNVLDAAATGCTVLDVNSSLETAPGVKSIAKLETFFAAWGMG